MGGPLTFLLVVFGLMAGLAVSLRGSLLVARNRATGQLDDRHVRRLRGFGLPLVAVLMVLFLVLGVRSADWIPLSVAATMAGLLVGGTVWQNAGRGRLFAAGMWLDPTETVRTYLAEMDDYPPGRAAALADLLLTHRHADRAFRGLGKGWADLSREGRARRLREKVQGRADPYRKARGGNRGPADAYRILGLRPSATMRQVKRAYRTLARKYHPDTGRVPDDERMKEINRAYERILKTSTRTG